MGLSHRAVIMGAWGRDFDGSAGQIIDPPY
jgi:hypothetical protein